jgi:LytS/YehU family sensor histidine kinase
MNDKELVLICLLVSTVVSGFLGRVLFLRHARRHSRNEATIVALITTVFAFVALMISFFVLGSALIARLQ